MSIEIFRDSLGIPHVRARTMRDAFFGQGFVHAQDRLWQMELDRRKAAGRSAEWIGKSLVTLDVFNRRMGLAAAARADYDAFDDETRSMLDAYVEGVNAFIQRSETPLEMTLLGVEPQPWNGWDPCAVLKVRHVLMGSFHTKIWRAKLARALGIEALRSMGAPEGREDLLIVPVGGRARAGGNRDDAEPGWLALASLEEESNSWAVHGTRTASGSPLLAGDPHRALEAPNVYYQNHVACDEFDAIGFSMPGTPGFFHFGHNAAVAWCITHAMADTQDLYVERFDESGRHRAGEAWLETEHRSETIAVRDGEDVEIEVAITRNGPVLFGDPREGTAISMRWTATDRPDTSLRCVIPMLRARDTAELEEAVRGWVDPCNNFVSADVHGSIRYLHRGRVPVRPAANGWLPVPGWDDRHRWSADIPFEELPRMRDPEGGFIVTANNRIVGADYPHYLSMDYSASNRAQRVFDRLESLRGATVEHIASIHADRISIFGRAIAEEAAKYLDALDGWDGSMDVDSAAAAYAVAIRDELAGLVLERTSLADIDEGSFLEEPYATPARSRVRAGVGRLLRTDDRVRALVEEAVARARGKLGPSPRWGDVHKTKTRHPLSRAFPDEKLDPPWVEIGGDADTVLAASGEDGYTVQHSSVARYVFDLADWDRSAWVVPLGSAGDPRSEHYGDQARAWSRVELFPMTYTWAKIEADAASRQALESR
ncbi:MAG: penicillin acylase family protein [Actinomycetota bacterium]